MDDARPLPFYHKTRIRCPRGEEPHVAVKRELATALRKAAERHRSLGARTLWGVSEPRFSDLVHGRLDRFTCDSLINMLAHAGYGVRIEVHEARDRRMGKRRHATRPGVKVEGSTSEGPRGEVDGVRRAVDIGKIG